MISFSMALTLLGIGIFANAKPLSIYPEQTYADAKADLINRGWRPVKNLKIHDSSLYAQDVYNLGFLEVVDCISMERDSCLFRLCKDKQVLEVKTVGGNLKVDSFKAINSSKNRCFK